MCLSMSYISLQLILPLHHQPEPPPHQQNHRRGRDREIEGGREGHRDDWFQNRVKKKGENQSQRETKGGEREKRPKQSKRTTERQGYWADFERGRGRVASL